MRDPPLHIACVHPEIPQNTGNIGRLCLGVGARLHLVAPLGFSISQKAVRRAGLDHWRHVDLQIHDDMQAFVGWCGGRRVHLFSSHGALPYTRVPFARGDVLVFGRESVGLPAALLEERGAYHIPLPGRGRSLNLSNSVAVVAYTALSHIDPRWF